MISLQREKIIAKFSQLDEYLGYLKDIQKVNKTSFLSDYHFFGLAERYLQLAIQMLIDVGQMIIIEGGLPKAPEPQEIFSILFNHKIISGELANKLTGIVGFRNILVHEYEDIDREEVYKYLQGRLDTFTLFKKEILRKIK